MELVILKSVVDGNKRLNKGDKITVDKFVAREYIAAGIGAEVIVEAPKQETKEEKVFQKETKEAKTPRKRTTKKK